MTTSPRDTLPLRGGARIPVLGLGVYQLGSGEPTRRAVKHALSVGYRHIDTARIYDNEADVGAAIRESGVPRDEIFVTTKLWNADHGYDRALRACDASLKRLGLDHVDLYLVHWPVADKRTETWRAMLAIQAAGKARAVGVSNYTVRHLREIERDPPAVNQIELHPFLFLRDVVAYCKEHGVVVEAYSPLTRGAKLKDPRIVAIANAVGRTPAQVLVRWGLQHGFVELPKSARPARIEENAGVFDFELTPEHMRALDALDEGLHTCWDPTDAP
jgi:diketogulonate reductase-like aldo/keto reductase